MELVVDIGNSLVKCAAFNKDKIEKFYSYKTDKNISITNLKKYKFNVAIISSVNKKITPIVVKEIKSLGCNNIIYFSKLEKHIVNKVNVSNKEIGDDLFADLFAAKKLYKTPTIIFDLGTVCKVLALDKNHAFIGASFFVSLNSSLNSLYNDTDALPKVKFNKVNDTIGKNTEEAIRSGVYYSLIYSINGFINSYQKIFKNKATIILTGGESALIYKQFKNATYDPFLTVKGIHYLYKENKYGL